MSKIVIIFTGTDPDTAKGGIGIVLPGYFMALQLAGYNYECIPTYYPSIMKGKWLPWLKALPVIFQAIRKIRKEESQAIIYSHVGDGISFFRETIILWLSKILGAKTVFQIHSPKVDGYINNPVKKFFFTLALLPADTICVLTEWWKARLENGGINTTIYVIPNPLPSNLLDIAYRTKEISQIKDASSIVILSMARLVPGKGVDIIIRAMADLPNDFRLIVAGDGSQRKFLECLASDLGVASRVHFTGWVSGNKKYSLLSNSDIFCLPSTYDAFPMSMIEAMSYGLPVVAVRWGGIPDMVSDGYSGILCDHDSSDDISGAIKQLQNFDIRQKMGDQAKKWVIQISHPKHVAIMLDHVIRDLIV